MSIVTVLRRGLGDPLCPRSREAHCVRNSARAEEMRSSCGLWLGIKGVQRVTSCPSLTRSITSLRRRKPGVNGSL